MLIEKYVTFQLWAFSYDCKMNCCSRLTFGGHLSCSCCSLFSFLHFLCLLCCSLCILCVTISPLLRFWPTMFVILTQGTSLFWIPLNFASLYFFYQFLLIVCIKKTQTEIHSQWMEIKGAAADMANICFTLQICIEHCLLFTE